MLNQTFFKRYFEKYKKFMISAQQFILLHVVYVLGIGLTAVVARLVGKHFLTSAHATSSWIATPSKKDSAKMF